MADMRWKDEREELVELLYRIQADHSGDLPEREAKRLGPWAPEAIKRARRIRWLVSKGSPPVLSVTNKGAKALDAALASREVRAPQHWFGGSIVSVHSETGPVLLPQSYEPFEELKRWALEKGVLAQEDLDRIARSKRKELEEPAEYRKLDEQVFPGTRGFAVALEYEESHPFGGGMMDPAGYEGAYEVAVTLTRRGAPDIPSAYVTDANAMEGDSHLWLPEGAWGDGPTKRLFVVYSSSGTEQTQFELLANRQGRLGQIRAVLRAGDADDARQRAYRLLSPFFCDLSYRYDVPVEVLQTNVAELGTLTLSGTKQDDFRERVFDPERFLGSGLAYEVLPNYEFFTRLYREGANSSSVDYGFLCFFRIAEGVVELRRRKVSEQKGKPKKAVPKPDVFSEDEVVEVDGLENPFPAELQGESLWKAFNKLEDERVKIGHAFLHDEDPVWGYGDIIADRLEGEERAGTRRAQARYLARRMLRSEFWPEKDDGEE